MVMATIEARLNKARDQLKAAMKEEDYETAAVLRDQIAELEGGLPDAKQ